MGKENINKMKEILLHYIHLRHSWKRKYYNLLVFIGYIIRLLFILVIFFFFSNTTVEEYQVQINLI